MECDNLHSVRGTDHGLLDYPLTCPPGQYCGWYTQTDAVGCCSSYYTDAAGVVSLTGCFYHTKCYDSSAGDACGTDTECAYCGNTADAYCFEISFTDEQAISYGCTNTPSLVIQAGYTVTNAIAGGGTSGSTSGSSSTSASATSASSYVFPQKLPPSSLPASTTSSPSREPSLTI